MNYAKNLNFVVKVAIGGHQSNSHRERYSEMSCSSVLRLFPQHVSPRSV